MVATWWWCREPGPRWVFVVFVIMRFIHVVAAVGTAIAVQLVAPLGLIGSAHADTGVKGYANCLGGDAKPPPLGVEAEDWFPSVHVMITDIDSGVPSAQVVQRLVNMGVNPDDAATRVRCFLATGPR